MSRLKKAVEYLKDSDRRFLVNSRYGFYDSMPDEEYIRRMFRARQGYELNLDSPETFNEKLQWIKLYDRRPVYTTMVDKYAVKPYVAGIIGEKYVIPTLGVWEHFDDIDFNSLPDKFVLKCTHDSGSVIVCRDKASFDKKSAKIKLEKALKQNYYLAWREWPYKNVVPRILAEKCLTNSEQDDIRDYKIYAFNGTAKAIFISSGRQSGATKADYFDADFNHLDFTWGYPNAEVMPQKPECFEEMIAISQKLSEGVPEVRVDLYEINGRVFFGELTLFDGCGFDRFDDSAWDKIFGSWIVLPPKSGQSCRGGI